MHRKDYGNCTIDFTSSNKEGFSSLIEEQSIQKNKLKTKLISKQSLRDMK